MVHIQDTQRLVQNLREKQRRAMRQVEDTQHLIRESRRLIEQSREILAKVQSVRNINQLG